jgi:hypothetical protein
MTNRCPPDHVRRLHRVGCPHTEITHITGYSNEEIEAMIEGFDPLGAVAALTLDRLGASRKARLEQLYGPRPKPSKLGEKR